MTKVEELTKALAAKVAWRKEVVDPIDSGIARLQTELRDARLEALGLKNGDTVEWDTQRVEWDTQRGRYSSRKTVTERGIIGGFSPWDGSITGTRLKKDGTLSLVKFALYDREMATIRKVVP